MNRLQRNTSSYSPLTPHAYRPLSVTLISFGVLIIVGLNLIRGYQAAVQWQFLSPLLRGLPLYQALSGFLWAAIWLPLAWGLWHGSRWALRLTPWVTLAYILYYWLDRLFLRRGLEPASLPFTFGVTIILLLSVFWVLSRAPVRAYFGDYRV